MRQLDADIGKIGGVVIRIAVRCAQVVIPSDAIVAIGGKDLINIPRIGGITFI